MNPTNEIWILGATGRIGSAVARDVVRRGLTPVLLGRDEARLRAPASTIPGAPRVDVADTVEAMTAAISRSSPAVVVNTVGPFARTALPVARACANGTHYVDISNELSSVVDLLSRHEEARVAGSCLVTGAGYGFLATESVVLKLCRDRPAASRVRVDTVPFISQGGVMLGSAVAASVVDSLAAGGRRYENGRLVRAGVGSDAQTLTLPDGTRVVTGSAPSADLEGAQRASRAPFVVAASSAVPSTPLTRLVVPILSVLVSWTPLRDFAVRRLARVRSPEPTNARNASWGHARVEWPDGLVREGWLRAGDGMVFTARVAADVAARLAQGNYRPGAYTPGALFGPEIAEAAGAQFILVQ
jgi:hypothetical protein